MNYASTNNHKFIQVNDENNQIIRESLILGKHTHWLQETVAPAQDTHTHMHICVYIYIYAYTHTYMYMCIYIYIYTHICISIIIIISSSSN